MTREKADADSGSEPKLKIEPRFYTLEQTATYLSVSVRQVYALVRSGELPAIKIGGRGIWRVGRDQLEEYVSRLHEETKAWAKAHPLNPKERGPGPIDEAEPDLT